MIEGNKVEPPFIQYTEQLGGSVELHHAVELQCNTPHVTMYYTIDGSSPYPWNKSAKIYDPSKGVILKKPGIVIIRACATADNMIDSAIFNSKRFSVGGESDQSSTESVASEDDTRVDMVSD